MPFAGDCFSVCISPAGCRAKTRRRQRLFTGAVAHPDLIEDDLAHELWERLAGQVDHQLLLDERATTGVAPSGSGDSVHANRHGIGGLLTVENLRQSGDGLADSITRKTM